MTPFWESEVNHAALPISATDDMRISRLDKPLLFQRFERLMRALRTNPRDSERPGSEIHEARPKPRPIHRDTAREDARGAPETRAAYLPGSHGHK
ncbi:MAG: hypothetical protein Ct9H90mP16_07470 [Candidatus Poseidoniales archaeon]|nr:MAG: hypothetical protein Ct9H90mP16_07470 [Candidatus Poseidoniales archaeon]